MLSDSHASTTVPQAATSLLGVCVRAIRDCPLETAVAEWLKRQADLSASARRQVASLLLFMDVVADSGRLAAGVDRWRSSAAAMSEALVQRLRRGYALAGCGTAHAALLGSPLLDRESLARILRDDPPLQRLENQDTRRNALRFACHVHEAIQRGTLVPDDNWAGELPSTPPFENAGLGARSVAGLAVEPPPVERVPRALHDQGTTVNPKRYRVARLQDDLWVYGMVYFECPPREGRADWLAGPDAAEQSRWLEQLAAALLQEADALRQSPR